ncbi:transglutaminase domain-containing protein [Flavobacterium sp. CYK-4]|uniref:transglutaminase-like domain-containing protein n=1 Tax=Flavobacterium lotistagni TaxID=2709660 RepID=UPI001409D1C0|nr:transglutaminase-like domain-containing protein [Flavobacterium lotistagni]NHM06317.1 transglutaminase domain-containing protein [Flavobacterium lotistagni]
MNRFFKKIAHTFKRHPLLYLIRYAILSKNGKGKNIEAMGCFNDINTLEDIPKLYFEVNTKIRLNPTQDDLSRAITIATYLRKVIPGGPGIGLSSEKTLAIMLEGKGGVCSDFAQIFSIFCFINGIRVKEWGIVDSLYKGKFGHAFNEIYSSELQQWIAIDIHKGILFVDEENEKYFSTLKLFQNLRAGKRLKVKYFSDYVSPKLERIPMIYASDTIPFLVNNKPNAVTDYYYNKLQNAPIIVTNALLVLLNKNQTLIFILDNYKIKLLPRFLQERWAPTS